MHVPRLPIIMETHLQPHRMDKKTSSSGLENGASHLARVELRNIEAGGNCEALKVGHPIESLSRDIGPEIGKVQQNGEATYPRRSSGFSQSSSGSSDLDREGNRWGQDSDFIGLRSVIIREPDSELLVSHLSLPNR